MQSYGCLGDLVKRILIFGMDVGKSGLLMMGLGMVSEWSWNALGILAGMLLERVWNVVLVGRGVFWEHSGGVLGGFWRCSGRVLAGVATAVLGVWPELRMEGIWLDGRGSRWRVVDVGFGVMAGDLAICFSDGAQGRSFLLAYLGG